MEKEFKLYTGESNFNNLIRKGCYYVDKTLLAEEVAMGHDKVYLLPRPRRFGKTLNLDMLYCFFDAIEAENNKPLFDNLLITKSKAWAHFGQYPTIFLSLKDMKEPDMSLSREKVYDLFIGTMELHRYLLTSDKLSDIEREKFRKGLYGEWTQTLLENGLRFLSECLYKHHSKQVVILVDE